ncbi:helix-turn-helix domain-containing protein [bacterium]|nr:helix-turn-helix domain-containing protein [bacterium]
MQIGKLLMEVRKEKGLTVAQVASELLIQEKYINAIEAGNFDAIPGETYQRAYFNKYADFLGVADYIDNIARSRENEPPEPVQYEDNPLRGEWDTARIIRVGSKILLILIIIIGIPTGIAGMFKNNAAVETEQPDNRVQSTQQLHVEPTDPSPWDIPRDTGIAPVAETGSNVHELILIATGECWVEVDTRDGVLWRETMFIDDELTYNDIFGFHVHAGRPEKLEVYLDGELLEWGHGEFDMVLPPGIQIFTENEPEPEVEENDAGDNETSANADQELNPGNGNNE